MPSSHLKQLKASIQTRRQNGRGKPSTSKRPLQGQPSASPSNSTSTSGLGSLPHRASPHKKPLARRPKSEGESLRRRTLLAELRQRHKVGGIVDRRIGEDDPMMEPEERAARRFQKAVERRRERGDVFNLEGGEGDGDEVGLTHLGRSVLEDGDVVGGFGRDDFDAGGLEDDDDEEERGGALFTKATGKRRLSEELDDAVQARLEEGPERKKTKKEVMQEVIAKSKLYKYERQQAKEDDEVLREELDKGMPDLLALLRGGPVRPVAAPAPAPAVKDAPLVHPDRAALMGGEERRQVAEKEYDKNLRQMALDKRAQPTDRTLTEEEIAVKEAARLKELEQKRQRRMMGENESSESESDAPEGGDDEDGMLVDEDAPNEAAEFGLEEPILARLGPADVEDEDQFIIDEDLVASGSDVDTDFSSDEDESVRGDDVHGDVDDDAEFLQDVIDDNNKSTEQRGGSKGEAQNTRQLAYTYPCPRNHAELLDVLRDTSTSDLPTVIQRIRTLYHPQLLAENKEKLSDFSCALVEHLSHMGTAPPPLPIIESVIRHLHSLSRSFPDAIARAFRAQLRLMQGRQSLNTGDLFILTAVGSIYPTSDHFHQVVTPAITLMARWLSLANPSTPKLSAVGAYIVALCIKYQTLSKRYIPEAVHYTLAALSRSTDTTTSAPHMNNLTAMMDLWADLPSFTEIFSPRAVQILTTHTATRALQKLRIMLSQARLRRRPLELHHHRPLPIKSSVPKFEEGFNPNKHYDVDRERAEAARLRKEHKREKKGAVRELRKDASFLARERLKEKKERDRAYEEKQRRLVAEIQGEEGREANAYEREKRARKGRR